MSTVRATVTPSILLNQQLGWRLSESSHSLIEDKSNSTLRLGKSGDYPIAPTEPNGTFGGQTLPKGVAISPSGFMLVVDTFHQHILYYDAARTKEKHQDEHVPTGFHVLWQREKTIVSEPSGIPQSHPYQHQISPYLLGHPQDIKISSHGEIIIADTENQRVSIFTWPQLSVRHQIQTENSKPIALDVDDKGNIYVAFQGESRIRKFNYLWQRDVDYCLDETGITSPTTLSLTQDNQLVVLCDEQNKVFLLDEQGRAQDTDNHGEYVFELDFVKPPLSIEEDSLVYPQLDKPNCDKWQLNGVELNANGDIFAQYINEFGLPVGTSINLLARPRVLRLPRNGEYFSQSFDSENLGSQWHRIVLFAAIPNTCKLTVQTYTNDISPESIDIFEEDWSQPMLLSADADDTESSVLGFEVLVQSGKGRYLSLRIGLYGDGFATPVISKIELFADRNSSLTYLPAPYKQDVQSEYFLDRWLSFFDTTFAEVRYLATDFTRYLDPHAVPAQDFLVWLGSWFNWTFLAQWPENTRREMIASAVRYYQMRGTLEGLRQMVQWHSGLPDEQINIIEHYRLRKQVEQGSTALPWFIGQKPFTPETDEVSHWFSVILPISAIPDQAAMDSLIAVINAQKPAHTGFRVCIINPGIRVGKQSSIGIDTWLGHYPQAAIEDLKLGQSSQLTSSSSLTLNKFTRRG